LGDTGALKGRKKGRESWLIFFGHLERQRNATARIGRVRILPPSWDSLWFQLRPTACAVGYILAPLRGSNPTPSAVSSMARRISRRRSTH